MNDKIKNLNDFLFRGFKEFSRYESPNWEKLSNKELVDLLESIQDAIYNNSIEDLIDRDLGVLAKISFLRQRGFLKAKDLTRYSQLLGTKVNSNHQTEDEISVEAILSSINCQRNFFCEDDDLRKRFARIYGILIGKKNLVKSMIKSIFKEIKDSIQDEREKKDLTRSLYFLFYSNSLNRIYFIRAFYLMDGKKEWRGMKYKEILFYIILFSQDEYLLEKKVDLDSIEKMKNKIMRSHIMLWNSLIKRFILQEKEEALIDLVLFSRKKLKPTAIKELISEIHKIDLPQDKKTRKKIVIFIKNLIENTSKIKRAREQKAIIHSVMDYCLYWTSQEYKNPDLYFFEARDVFLTEEEFNAFSKQQLNLDPTVYLDLERKKLEERMKTSKKNATIFPTIPIKIEDKESEAFFIDNSFLLREEGKKMSHCVASYEGILKQKHIQILSIKRKGVFSKNDSLNSTVEYRFDSIERRWTIIQHRSAFNGSPNKKARSIAKKILEELNKKFLDWAS